MFLGIGTAVISMTLQTVPFVDTAQAVPIPAGFKLLISDTGVQVYKKDYAGGQPDYVTVIDLRRATIRNLAGSLPNPPDGRVHRKSLSSFWNDAAAKNTSTVKAKVVVNAAFFSTNDNPTGIAFGLKVADRVISYGYEIGNSIYNGLIRTFSFNSSQKVASIQAYARGTFDSPTPEVVGALDPTADKSASSYVGRTFVGVRDDDGNGTRETVILFSSSYARQIDASNVLTGFGASEKAMLDGGGSTGLIINGTPYISTSRMVPHAIAVYAGK